MQPRKPARPRFGAAGAGDGRADPASSPDPAHDGAAIAAKPALARSTVARWLRCEGLGRLAWIDPPALLRRYQRARPGELIHLDIQKSRGFDQPGHRVTGTRVGCHYRGAGRDFVRVAVDDATRLAYVEVPGDERRDTTTGLLLRALRWFRAQATGPTA